MLTPQEVSGQEFSKAVFGGYDMAAVDDFLEVLTKDYSDLYKENAVLKNKMKVLVEKIEEYRSTEDAMRMALLPAQRMAKEITDEAEKKSRSLLEDAERDAREQIEEYQKQVKAEEKKVEAAKAKTAEFVQASEEILNKHKEILKRLDEYAVPEVPAEPAPVFAEELQSEKEKMADEIEKSVAQFIEDTIGTDAAEKEDAEVEDTKVFRPVSGEGRKLRFDIEELKFGDDYDAIK